MKKRKQEQYAFWYYDLCPYVLGGKVSSPMQGGLVFPDGFQGMGFKPLAVIRGKKGRAALDSVNRLMGEYFEKSRALKAEYRSYAQLAIGLKGKK